MITRLRIKFVFINMLIVLVLLSVIFSMVLYFTRSNMEQESIQRMRAALSSHFQPGPPGTPPDAPQNAPFKEPGFSYFIVHKTAQGKINTTGSPGSYEEFSSEFLSELIDAISPLPKESGVLPQYQLRFYRASPVEQLFVFTDISAEEALLQSLSRSCFFIGAISFAAFFLVSLFWAYWAVLPVENAWKQQMRSLVERLLELARLDNGTVQSSFTTVPLSQLISDAVLPFEPLYFEKGLELQCKIERSLFVKGNISQLRQVADILLDNALKYSLPHSTVFILLKRQGSHCIFSVESQGETISRSDLKNIFKRFYRIDKARSTNHSYGLGLPIAEHIIKEHRGKIWAESSHGHNRFLIQLSSIPAAIRQTAE